MWNGLKELDRILRGEATRPAALQDGTIRLPLGALFGVILLLAAVYGLCMGCYSIFREVDPAVGRSYMQLVATTVKVPLLFFLTLTVTFPSLYVFNALVGSRLTLVPVLKLLIASLGVNLAVLASLGPIVAFFSVSTTNYSFMVLLNVFVFSVSGLLGLAFLLQTLNRLTVSHAGALRAVPPAARLEPAQATNSAEDAGQSNAPGNDTGPAESHSNEAGPLQPTEAIEAEVLPTPPDRDPSALDSVEGHVLGQHVKRVFGCWVVVFALVGAQMAWVLRPFIGNPASPFQWFRARGSNFFESVWYTFLNLFA